MLPAGVAHYLTEIARVLAPDGTCAASVFLLNDDRRADVEAGRSFMPFPAVIESARLHDTETPVERTRGRSGHDHRAAVKGGPTRTRTWNEPVMSRRLSPLSYGPA